MVAPSGRWTRTTVTALAVAAAWSVLLVVGAFVLPVYAGPDGGATFVGRNGYGVLLVVGLPLVVTLLAAEALAGGRHRRRAWILTTLLGVVGLVTVFTVGLFLLPAALALVVACGATPRAARARPEATRAA